jgi:hypothetical protein
MRAWIRGPALACAALALLQPSRAAAYEYHDYRWNGFPVVWYLDESSEEASGIPLADLEPLLEEAFRGWAAAEYAGTCTSILMEYGGLVDAQGVKLDNMNVISFQGDPGYPGEPRSFALTVPVYRDHVLIEVDLVLHVRPDAPLAVDPGPDEFDLPGIVLHELGHFYGLDHTDVPAATMYGTFPPAGDVSWQTLEPDDLQGITSLYPLPCGDPCTAGGAECGPGEICHPQTERCFPDPECGEILPPSSGCSTAGEGAPRGGLLAVLAVLLACASAPGRRR